MAKLPTGVEIRSGSICIWFMHRGERCREVLTGWINTPANIKKAGNLRTVIVSEINLGEFDYAKRFPHSVRAKRNSTSKISTFGELASTWLKNREIELTANTLRKTGSQLNTLVHIIGEHTPITDISQNDILHYRNQLLHGETRYPTNVRGNKEGRTVRTVDNYISLLCSLLRFAHRSDFISGRPFEGIKKLQKSRPRPDPLLKHEFEQLVGSLSGQSKNLWQLAVYTGLRHGELLALAWEDIDLDAGVIHVSRNLTTLGDFGPPKTLAGIRTVTLLKPALEALQSQIKITGNQRQNDIVYHHREYGLTEIQQLRFVFLPRLRKGEQKISYSFSSIGQLWNAAVKRSGIRRRNPYHTRHTYACWLLSAGANPSFIASQMGHENAQMVYEIYGKWIEDMNEDQVGMLNRKLAL
ncbi:Arm DNA-binding domain-containing protein [Pectobacterium sp. LFLA-215]|uniref:Arm DNA-binding domain-containing protein n=1 Tax=Pectobacterium sp. LFLA-215 TaxID=3419008 RepID=UPI003F5C2828